MDNEYAKTVAGLNDKLRKSMKNTVITQGVQVLDDVLGLMIEIYKFNAFTTDNDPHEEHDFGSVTWKGTKVFWKIDYYDASMQHMGDPTSSKCNRVMTVMLASEY